VCSILRFLGMMTIWMNEIPYLKVGLLATMGVYVLLSKE
jgi:hypothetical protein